MADNDMIPVRDSNPAKAQEGLIGLSKQPTQHIDENVLGQRLDQERLLVSKWSHEELEDKYFRIYEENIVLKKHAWKQEEKIKKLATKLLRMINDKKKSSKHPGRFLESDREYELNSNIRELEKQNQKLKDQLSVTRQQLLSHASQKRNRLYGQVPPRIDTGRPVRPKDSVSKQVRPIIPATQTIMRGRAESPPLPRYGHSLLEDTRAEKKRLEDTIEHLRERINLHNQDMNFMQEQMKIKEEEYEEKLLELKQQTNVDLRSNLQENVDLIRLQREVKEKSMKLLSVQNKYAGLEENLTLIKASHEKVLEEVVTANEQLAREQNNVRVLENKLKLSQLTEQQLSELTTQIADAKHECAILKEANEKLVASAFDMEREREWRQRETALKVQIAQLEAALKSDVGEKGTVLDGLTRERTKTQELNDELSKLRKEYYKVKEQHDDMKEKVSVFEGNSALNMEELEEALSMIKDRKAKGSGASVPEITSELAADYQRKILAIETEHADTIAELEKTRNLLLVQYRINKDYQSKVEALADKLETLKRDYDMKLDQYAKLLDVRAAKIRQLESQMRDVAYGTKQYFIRDTEDEPTSDDAADVIHLERGENLFKIHIDKVVLSSEAVKLLGMEEPTLFCTWDFFEYETQTTPVLKSFKPEFQFTSEYVVKVDDFFLQYLQKETVLLELHQSFGTDYNTVAMTRLSLRGLLDKSAGKLHAQAALTGIGDAGEGMNYGFVEFWVCLKVPMEQAFRLYKERLKALGYIQANKMSTDISIKASGDAPTKGPDNVNVLQLSLITCSNVKSVREGVQPSTYVVYKFYDFPDHDTCIVKHSCSPQFNDTQRYPVAMTRELDTYLISGNLQLFVFDDDDDTTDTSYLGAATIPLLPLTQRDQLSGDFEIKHSDGRCNGSMQISIRWQYMYLAPSVSAPQAPISKPLSGYDFRKAPDESISEQARDAAVAESGVDRHAGAGDKVLESVDDEAMRILAEAGSSTVPSQVVPDREIPLGTRSLDADLQKTQTISTKSVKGLSTISERTEPVARVDGGDTGRLGIDELIADELGEAVPVPHARRRLHSGVSQPSEHESTLTSLSQTADSLEGRGRPTSALTDTMFEEERDEIDEEEDDEAAGEVTAAETEADEDEGVGTPSSSQREEGYSTADSEGLVTPVPAKHPKPSIDVIHICVNNLSLNPQVQSVDDRGQPLLYYVAYDFLDVNSEQLETPYSLPLPKSKGRINYNFHKTFHVDPRENASRRKRLANMLLPSDPEKGRVTFSVVAEPQDEDSDTECQDVGLACVSLPQILSSQRDPIDADFPVYSSDDEGQQVIGRLNLSIECARTLKLISQEYMPPLEDK